jgi:GTP-binding protein
MMMSSVAGEGVTEVLRTLRQNIDDDRLRFRTTEEDTPWQP